MYKFLKLDSQLVDLADLTPASMARAVHFGLSPHGECGSFKLEYKDGGIVWVWPAATNIIQLLT